MLERVSFHDVSYCSPARMTQSSTGDDDVAHEALSCCWLREQRLISRRGLVTSGELAHPPTAPHADDVFSSAWPMMMLFQKRVGDVIGDTELSPKEGSYFPSSTGAVCRHPRGSLFVAPHYSTLERRGSPSGIHDTADADVSHKAPATSIGRRLCSFCRNVDCHAIDKEDKLKAKSADSVNSRREANDSRSSHAKCCHQFRTLYMPFVFVVTFIGECK